MPRCSHSHTREPSAIYDSRKEMQITVAANTHAIESEREKWRSTPSNQSISFKSESGKKSNILVRKTKFTNEKRNACSILDFRISFLPTMRLEKKCASARRKNTNSVQMQNESVESQWHIFYYEISINKISRYAKPFGICIVCANTSKYTKTKLMLRPLSLTTGA